MPDLGTSATGPDWDLVELGDGREIRSAIQLLYLRQARLEGEQTSGVAVTSFDPFQDYATLVAFYE